MKTNTKVSHPENNQCTAPGAPVNQISYIKQLERTVLACLLFEDIAYESGESVAQRIKNLVSKVKLEDAAALAIKARTDMKLRHVPLLIVREMARHPALTKSPGIVSNTLVEVIQRPDELTEFLSLYWSEGKSPLSAQVKKGLARAFVKFNEYSLAKFQGNGAVKLRDVLFLSHAKPVDHNGPYVKEHRQKNDQHQFTKDELLFKKVVDQTLETPDTWEVALSSGADKKETFERLMSEKKLGALAFLRNLRGMTEARVSEKIIREYATTLNVEKVLPFQFLSAAKYAPMFEDMLEGLMFRCLENHPKLKGRTVLIVDTSGSMSSRLSGKSELSRYEAAAAVAILAREICEEVVIYATAGDDVRRKAATMVIPPRRGFALKDYILGSEVRSKIGYGGIFLKQCKDYVSEKEQGNTVDRVMVFTDEQDCDIGVNPDTAVRIGKYNYIFNIGSHKNGINSGKWETITGFSEAIFDYVQAIEHQEL